MDLESARTAQDSLELIFQMSIVLDSGLDRRTLSLLIALCDVGINPESLATIVKELHEEYLRNLSSSAPPATSTGTAPTTTSSLA